MAKWLKAAKASEECLKQGHPQYLVKDYEKNDDKENQKDDPNDLASHLF